MHVLIDWVSSWTRGGDFAIFVFLPLVFLLLYASLKIVGYSEVIITKSKFGGGFIGGVILALVTSIPELITEISQGAAGTPGNGLSDDIGSNLFSIFLIGIAAFASYKYMFLNQLGKGTKITIIFSFFVSLILTIFLSIGTDVKMGSIGLMPMIIFLLYIFSIFIFYRYSDEDPEDADIEQTKYRRFSLKKSIIYFVIWSLVVVVFSLSVNVTVSSFQAGTGIKSESAGGIMLAITTSLPEIVAFVSFLKKRKPTVAIASLVGSHFFNLAIIFFGDIAYTKGPSFRNADVHAQLPLAIMLCSLLVLLIAQLGLSYKFKKLFEKKAVYFIIPSLMIVSYIVGWAMILIYN